MAFEARIRPGSPWKCRSSASAAEWNVEARTPSTPSARRRVRSPPAALSVNVTATICCGGKAPLATCHAIRRVIVVVFPVPAPARMHSGPRVVSAAARCSGFRPARIVSASRARRLAPPPADHRDGRVRGSCRPEVRSRCGSCPYRKGSAARRVSARRRPCGACPRPRACRRRRRGARARRAAPRASRGRPAGGSAGESSDASSPRATRPSLQSSSWIFSPGREPTNAIRTSRGDVVGSSGRRGCLPERRIMFCARSTIRTGSPMSSTNTWPRPPIAPACTTRETASGIVMK